MLREQFVELYTQPLLEELRNSLMLRFPHVEFPPVPSRGNLDLDRVMLSDYFFD
jgi:DNA-directed RNA polymerase